MDSPRTHHERTHARTRTLWRFMIPRQHAGLPHRHDIVFFERNGLRHGEVTLPFGPKQVQVVEMGWNANSTMLAVWAEALPSEGEGDGGLPPRTWLQVWTMSNYHWYLKQEFTFDGPTHREPMASFAWDVENANRLLMALQCGQLHEYTFYGSVDQTRGLTSVNPAAVAVVDGQQLQLTPFRLAVVPPPMPGRTHLSVGWRTTRLWCTPPSHHT